MTGAESIIRTLIDADVRVCFANPGTTEMPLVRALDATPEMRPVLCLFEGVATGAADGYARMSEKPGLTLLHLGPGFANGIAYLHDARRARSAIINLVGEHATWHIPADPPLHSDIESLARPVSAWVHRSVSGGELARDTAEAIAAASVFPGQIATLIVPHDCQLEDVRETARPRPTAAPPRVNEEAIKQTVTVLRGGDSVALFLGGYALRARGLQAAARIAAVAPNCKLLCETFPTRWERGAGTPVIDRLPYFPEAALAALEPYTTVILAGAKAPVSFFGYPGLPSYFISPNSQTLLLASPEDDIAAALEDLADALGAPVHAQVNENLKLPELPGGKVNAESLSAIVAALLPDNAIVMDESNTSMGPFCAMSKAARPHSYLTQPGGAIGLGLPCATGAAVACPDRTVINLQADGSAMYTIQALWTQARESLNVKTILLNNHSYRILGLELMRAGAKEFGLASKQLISLGNPEIDWTGLSQSLGVPAVRVETAEELAREFSRALSEDGPQLIEAIIT